MYDWLGDGTRMPTKIGDHFYQVYWTLKTEI